jgi:serine/threonine protein kinase
MKGVIRDNQVAYRIVRQVAAGGMGSVYEAVQSGSQGFQKRVALKTLLPELGADSRFADLFAQEARLVANLVHENIVQIYHLGQSTDGHFIVMEYVNGLSLNDLQRIHLLRETRLPLPLAVFVCSRLARGLAYAHDYRNDYGEPLDIVHRDICPSNLMITTNGLVKLTDFGIATATTEWDIEHPGTVLGRFEYMSPEHAHRRGVDRRADVYAIGAVLFELLSGQRIREAESQDALLEQARAGLVRWSALPAEVPGELRSLLERLLAIEPDERVADASEVAEILERFIYRDGYGPTNQTLAAHLRETAPYLYEVKASRPRRLTKPGTEAIDAMVADKTG